MTTVETAQGMTRPSDSDGMADGAGAGRSWKAVPRVSQPDTSWCALFERGHHAHPMQVSMAMKRGGDDGGFVTLTLDHVTAVEAGDRRVTQMSLLTESGEPLVLVNHDAELVERLRLIEEPTFVWEAEYGVLFPLTDQARNVLGTGALTLCAQQDLAPCAN